MAKQLLNHKIDTKINADTLAALENYMAANQRNKSDTIRLLLIRALEMETKLQNVKQGDVDCEHVMQKTKKAIIRNGIAECWHVMKCIKCGYEK